jgi:hypothetical protein
MTITEIIDEVCGPINYDPNNATHIARALRWINAEALDSAWLFDWPDYISRNDTFTTDGSESYDLSSDTYFDSTFLRVMNDSVRIGNTSIRTLDKSYFDVLDPARTYGGTARACCQLGRTKFLLWPAESSGSTVTLDWMAAPETITTATAEADLPFGSGWHEILVTGGMWRGMRYKGMPEYERYKAMHEHDRLKSYNNSHGMKMNITYIQQADF